MKTAIFCFATLAIAFATYIGTMVILGTTIMHDDWRLLFVAGIPSLVVIGYAFAKHK